MAADNPPRTVAGTLHRTLRSDILLGRLRPGARLGVRQLAAEYGAGAIPLREALNRLSSEGLVSHEEQRGFFVADVSEADVVDLTRTRIWLYAGALRASIAAGDQAWEERIVVEFYRLGKLPRYDESDPSLVNEQWLDPHRRFHTALIAACGSSRTVALSESMFDEAERYRYLARLVERKPAVHEEHRIIMEAVLRREADDAVEALATHLQHTCDTVVEFLRTFPNSGEQAAHRRRGRDVTDEGLRGG